MPGIETDPRAPELSIADKLRWCLSNLGQRITTVAVNPAQLDASVVRAWADGSVPADSQPRVSMLYDAAARVSEVYDEQTARAFLRSSNPDADDMSLLTVIAQSGPEEARVIVDHSLRAFLD
ncbi:MAG: hypothetical protein JWM81_204 [Candidatus Saccharibacteria bacterium]|nr:hypothetical protein [Candidatus Saccharibacteria bacterium]